MADVLKDVKTNFSSFNRNLNKLKNFFDKLKQKQSISEEEKNIFTVQLTGLKNENENLKILMASTKEKLSSDMSRITYDKIVKDHDNLQAILNKISLEFLSIPVSSSAGSSSAYNVSGNKNNFSGSGFEGDQDSRGSDRALGQATMFIEVKDVDEEIIKERETEIKNIHKDITMLNDMYK